MVHHSSLPLTTLVRSISLMSIMCQEIHHRFPAFPGFLFQGKYYAGYPKCPTVDIFVLEIIGLQWGIIFRFACSCMCLFPLLTVSKLQRNQDFLLCDRCVAQPWVSHLTSLGFTAIKSVQIRSNSIKPMKLYECQNGLAKSDSGPLCFSFTKGMSTLPWSTYPGGQVGFYCLSWSLNHCVLSAVFNHIDWTNGSASTYIYGSSKLHPWLQYRYSICVKWQWQ